MKYELPGMTDIVVSLSNHVLILWLNRPDRRNALATDMLQAVAAALQQATVDADCRVVIITGTKDVFAAGADIDELAQLDADDSLESPRFLAWQVIRAFQKPLIAAVEGWCLGAGLELALTADVIVAGTGSQFGQPETNLGIIPGGGATGLLTLRVGKMLASKMILTGRPISAETALAAGLVSELAEKGSALDQALKCATELAARAPRALIEAKACIRAVEEMPLADHHREERRRFVSLMATRDKTEGIAAFQERRKPVWTGS